MLRTFFPQKAPSPGAGAPTSPPRERWWLGKIVPQTHLSLWGRGRRAAAGEGAFWDVGHAYV